MSRKTIFFAIFFFAATVGLFSPLQAKADIINYIGAEAVSVMVLVITQIVGSISGVLLSLGGYLLSFILDLTMKLTALPVVTLGWRITRDLANLGFVLAIIIIAFATIIRNAGYGAKNTLVKLIAAAILINFSLVIAGVFLDFSNVLGSYFLEKASLRPQEAANTFTSAFAPQKALDVEGKSVDLLERAKKFAVRYATTTAFERTLQNIISLLFTVIFTLIAALSMITIALMLLVRYIAIAMLLVLMPLAWLFWILPATEHMWKKWWTAFLKYVFFLPSVSFFLYLAIMTLKFKADINRIGNAAITLTDLGGFIKNDGLIAQISQMIILMGFLIGGLYVASTTSVMGGKYGYNVAEKWGKGAKAWMNNRAQGVKNRALSAYGQQAQTALSRVPGLKGLTTYIGSATANLQKAVADKEKEYSTLNVTALRNLFDRTGPTTSNTERAALTAALAKKDVEQLSVDEAWAGIEAARRIGSTADMEAFFPQFAQNIAAAIRQANWSQVHSSALIDPQIITNISKIAPGTLTSLANENVGRALALGATIRQEHAIATVGTPEKAQLTRLVAHMDKNPVYQ